MRRSVGLVALASVLAVAACAPAPSAPTGGLRGYPEASVDCAYPSAPPPAPVAVTGKVTQFVLCASRSGGSPILVKPGSPHYEVLAAALSEPDGPVRLPLPFETRGCPTMAQSMAPILAVTSTGTWLIRVPVDECWFSRPDVDKAIELVRAPVQG